MTAELDMSPEAVERLARELEDEALAAQRSAWGRADGGFDCSISAVLADNAAATIRALAAENARLRAERDAAWQAGAVAMREAAARTCILSAQDIAEGDWGSEGLDMAAMLKRWIGRRSLPIPDKDGE